MDVAKATYDRLMAEAKETYAKLMAEANETSGSKALEDWAKKWVWFAAVEASKETVSQLRPLVSAGIRAAIDDPDIDLRISLEKVDQACVGFLQNADITFATERDKPKEARG